jgi:phosphoribosylamine--glycine ligase
MGDSWVNFAGVKQEGQDYFSSGGRVLSCSAIASSLSEAAELSYQLMNSIALEGSHYRLDIGGKAL